MDNTDITILIVDDTAANLQVLTSIVTTEGYNILLAQTGEEALRLAGMYLPDVILLDIMMPGMDGFEVCRRLKGDNKTRQIPVIFVTARTDTEAVEKGFDVKGDDYVSKPFNDRELLARLKTHVERYKLQRDITREHALMTSVLEDSPIMFCRFNNKYELEYVNQAFQFWFGASFSDLEGANLLQRFPERDELNFIRHLDTLSVKKQSDTKIFSGTGPEGERHYIQWTYRAIFNRNDEAIAYQCFGKDVTDQEQMIRDLNARNILLEHSQIAGKMMNWEMDPRSLEISFEHDVSLIFDDIGKDNMVGDRFDMEKFFDTIHPDDQKPLRKKLKEYAEGKSPMSYFFRVVGEDKTYSLRIHAFYERDKTGRVTAYRGILQNVSELVSYKEHSEHLEREKASMFEALGEGIIMLDLEENIVQANDAAAWMAGFEASRDIIGKKCFRVFHQRNRPCSPCTSRNAVKAGKRVQTEKTYLNDRIWNVSSTPIYNKDGKLINVIEVLSDTTELHKQQRELLLSRERLNTAFDAAQIGTFTVHFPEERWVPDEQLKRLYGLKNTEDELLLKDWFGLVHPEDRKLMRGSMNRCLKKKIDTCKFEFRIQAEHRASKWFRCSTQVIERNESGRPSLIMGVSIDITREHEMLDTIRKQEENLAQSRKLRAMGQLTGGIAHDFNNMLATILGFAELLTEELKEDEELSYYCKNITDTCERAASLTSQLLTFSRKQRKQSTAIDVHDLILNSLELLQHSLPQNIRIKQNLNAREHYIMGEFAQLQNVLLNLAFNARDAMPDGGEFEITTENITVREKDLIDYPVEIETGNYIAVRVRDTGAGMDKALLSKIFEPFFTTKSAEQGTGLGLSSAYGTVYAHNGYIYPESTPGKGSVFHLLFPVSPLKPEQDKAEAPATKRFSADGASILIVDDERAIRSMLSRSLTYLGFRVMEAAAGEEAIRIYKDHREEIAAVILDIVMPGMDGVQVYKALKKIDPDVAVLFSSGFANEAQTNAIRQLGSAAILKKPYRQSDLAHALKKLLKPAGTGR